MSSMSGNGSGGPSAALALSAIGLALQVVAGYFAFAFRPWYGFWYMGPWMMGRYYGGPYAYYGAPYFPALVYVALVAVVIALGLTGVLLMAGRGAERVRAGSVLVIVAAVIAFPTMFGFIVGSLLILVGGLLGLLGWGYQS